MNSDASAVPREVGGEKRASWIRGAEVKPGGVAIGACVNAHHEGPGITTDSAVIRQPSALSRIGNATTVARNLSAFAERIRDPRHASTCDLRETLSKTRHRDVEPANN